MTASLKALDEQQAALDNLILKSRRPKLGEGRGVLALSHNAMEHKAAFDSYIRKGAETDLRQLEAKAMSIGSDPDGGYLVPEQVEAEVGKTPCTPSLRSVPLPMSVKCRDRP